MDAVSPILVDRAREPQGLRMTVVVSLVVHGVVALILLFGPPLVPIDTTPHTVMTISLGRRDRCEDRWRDPDGRRDDPEGRAGHQALASASGGCEAGNGDSENATKDAPPPKATAKILQDEKPRALPKAAQASTGDARIQTQSHTQGLGLSTTGSTGTGGYLDVQNFCCPEYLTTMVQLIQRNWNGQQDVAGQTLMKFTVLRDGRISGIQVERGSGYFALDQGAQRALIATRQLPPLPPQFPDQSLAVHLNFQYVTH